GLKMGKKQMLGFTGSILLAAGVFAPLLNLPAFKSINYLSREVETTIILILAATSFVLTLTRKYKWLWFTGVGSLLTLTFSFIYFRIWLHEIKLNMETLTGGSSLANTAIPVAQFQWGGILLILGAVLIIVTAAIKDKMIIHD
ncbi:MAG: hypothetical protein NTY22_02515, partial [Proteobacteria bacterium]|nr:hypothetical protein [Pseudomonadota bacterium]